MGSSFEANLDLFDRLPDEIVLSIFGKLLDARSLCSSMAVCKCFRSIAPMVDEVFLPIPLKKLGCDRENRGFFRNLVMKPLNFISRLVKLKSKNEENDLHFYSGYVPNQILKPFGEIRGLHLRVPCHQKQGKSGKHGNSKTFLKWKAEFGRDFDSCVILGAKSWSEKREEERNPSGSGQESRVMAAEELKLRIVWTISCLIAASARHYLIQETVRRRGLIENVVVSDESDQGRLCMNKQQIEEMRESEGDEMFPYRSRVPALRMNMWNLDRLEYSGKVMEGATLVVIRPAPTVGGGDGAEEGRKGGRRVADMVAGAFGEGEEGEALDEVVRKLMVAKKRYTLEMNSF